MAEQDQQQETGQSNNIAVDTLVASAALLVAAVAVAVAVAFEVIRSTLLPDVNSYNRYFRSKSFLAIAAHIIYCT